MSKKLMRKKLALMLSNLKKKRPFYTEVEYLESSGTQYIETSIVPTPKTEFETRASIVEVKSNACFFGATSSFAWNQFNNSTFALANTSSSGGSMFFTYSNSGQTGTIQNVGVGIDFTAEFKNYTLKVNGTTIQTYTAIDSWTNEMPALNIFSRSIASASTDTKGKYRIYYLKLWDDGSLVGDFIPVLDWDMTPCMYDRVTEQLFYNAGTGDFIAGREIHPVDYLESTGTQWIDTGINVNTSTDEIKLYFQLTDTEKYKWLFGEYDTNARLGLGSGNAPNNRSFLYKQSSTAVSDTQVYDKQHLFEINSNGGFLDGTKIRDYANFASTSTIYLFNLNINETTDYRCKAKIWKYEHKRNGVLVRDMIPAIDSDGVAYLFDRVSHTIYDNAGTGAFSYPAREVEYLESTGTQYINLNYIPTDTTGYKMGQVIPISNRRDNVIIGCRQDTNSDTRFWQDIDWTSANKTIGWGFGRYSQSGQRYSIDGKDGTYVVTSLNYMNDRAGKVDDVSYDTSLESKTLPEISIPMYLFAGNVAGTVNYYTSTKVYFVQITEGNALVRDFIPSYKDGVLGMWDKTNEIFYQNSGTGTFTTGRILEEEYE